MRFSELKKHFPLLSDTVLSSSLKEMVRDDLVQRKSYNEVPMRVEYSLTEKGKSAVPILESIFSWAAVHQEENLCPLRQRGDKK